jgi:predicted acetyltransferase
VKPSAAVEVRLVVEAELPLLAALREQGYGLPAGQREAWADQMLTTGRAERFLGAYRDGRLVGMLNVLALGQWFGGRAVPMGGVASVVVAPEERGLGVAPSLLARALELMAERGEVISTLAPATSWVYRKAGWEHAELFAVASVRTSELAALPSGESRERRAGANDRDAIIAAYDRVAASRPGFLARPVWMWDERLNETAQRYVYVVERDGRVDGYVSYSQSRATLGYTVWVDDLVAAGGDSELTLWRHLGAHVAQADRVTIAGVPLDALALRLPEQTIRPVGQQAFMTRIVDAAGAVAQRGYPRGVHTDVPFRLVDPMVGANDGCWRLVVDAGEGRLEPLGEAREPDLSMTINGLASLFTGYSSSAVLAASGAARGLSREVASDLDAIFGGRRPTLCDEY